MTDDGESGGADTTRTYRMRSTAFRVRTNDADAAIHLDRLCRQFSAPLANDLIDFRLDRTGAESWAVTREGRQLESRGSALGAAVRLEWHMVTAAVHAERSAIQVHGAALTQAGHTVLIPGASGIGKSTLTLALAANGFELLGDDVIFIDPESGSVHPFHRAPHVHDDAIPRLMSAGFAYRSDLRIGPYLESRAVETWRHQPAPPLTHVLFVEWDQDGPVETVPKTQAETAIELARVSHNLRSWPDAGLPQLQRVLTGTTSYQILRGQDLTRAITVVQAIVDGPQTPSAPTPHGSAIAHAIEAGS